MEQVARSLRDHGNLRRASGGQASCRRDRRDCNRRHPRAEGEEVGHRLIGLRYAPRRGFAKSRRELALDILVGGGAGGAIVGCVQVGGHMSKISLALVVACVFATAVAEGQDANAPLMIAKQGSFFVGGHDVHSETLSTQPAFAPTGTITVEQMYVRYQVPVAAKRNPITF